MHWESYYFPAAGFPITRGWYRQADALHNGELYDEQLDAEAYALWLRRMGVEYVFVPHAPLVDTSRREAALLGGSEEFELTYRGAEWSVYRLLDCEPLVVPFGRADPQVYAMDHTSIRFGVTRPGPYLVKVTWSPYWRLARRPRVRRRGGRDGRAGTLWRSDALEPGDQPRPRTPTASWSSPRRPRRLRAALDVAGAAQAELSP